MKTPARKRRMGPRAIAILVAAAIGIPIAAVAIVDALRARRTAPEALRPEAARGSAGPSASDEAHYDRCVELQAAGEKERALAEALAFLAGSPDDIGHNLLAGSLLFEAGRYREAVERIEKGLRAPPGEVERRTTDRDSVRCQLAECHRILGRTDEAKAAIDSILASNPRHRPARRIAASLAFGRRDFARSIEILEALFREDPADAEAAPRLARVALDAGKPERAAEVARAHLAAGGARTEELLLTLARALTASGRASEGVGIAGEILLRDPDADEAYFVIADALARAGKPDLAKPFRDRHAAATPLRAELGRAGTVAAAGHPESAAYYRGRAYAAAGRFAPALREIQLALRLAPKNAQTAAAHAEILIDADRPLDALDLIEGVERAAGGAPLPAEIPIAKARVAHLLGLDGDARAALREGLRDGRRDREVARLAARIAIARDDRDAIDIALSPFGAEAEIDPEIRAWTGIEVLLAGDAARAAECLEPAVAALPAPSAAARLALARARLAIGRRAEAAEVFRALIASEDLLHHTWVGIRAASDDPDEAKRAEAWLAVEPDVRTAIRREWEGLRKMTDAKASVAALLRVAGLRSRLGERDRARALVALARDLDPSNPAAHRYAVNAFDRPQDTFVRLHSLEALRILTPGDPVAEGKRKAEYAALGFAPPAP